MSAHLKYASDMQVILAKFLHYTKKITGRFSIYREEKSLISHQRNKALKCRGGEIRTPDLLLPKQD